MIKVIKYFFEAVIIYLFFFIIKLIGLSLSRSLFSFIFNNLGPFIKSSSIVKKNLNIYIFSKLIICLTLRYYILESYNQQAAVINTFYKALKIK